MVKNFFIADRRIGEGHPCFLIAEAGVNHNGNVDLALRLIDAAKDAGADAVKFQTFKTEKVISRQAPMADYQKTNTGRTETQFDMVKRLELSQEVFRTLKQHCDRKGVLFLSTPFDAESADFLEGLRVPAFKIPSGEITNHPFLAHLARKGLPLVVSTGMSTLVEVEAAFHTMKKSGATEAAFLHCVSSYPAPPEDVNLRAMRTLKEKLGVPVGYSDHTEGIEIPLAAVALGASIIEKHFTLDRTLPGPDHRASLEPRELTAMVAGIRKIEQSLGTAEKRPAPCETNTRDVARRSLVAAAAIRAGTRVTETMIDMKRPGTGLGPEKFELVLGRKALRDITEGAILSLEMFE